MTFTRPPIRASREFRTLSGLAIVAALLLSTPARAAAQEYSEVVVFGDSLSDSGNAFALRGVANTPPDYALDPLLIPGRSVRAGRSSFSERRNLGRAAGTFAAGRRQRPPGVSIARRGCA